MKYFKPTIMPTGDDHPVYGCPAGEVSQAGLPTQILRGITLGVILLASLSWSPTVRAATPVYVRPDGEDFLCDGTFDAPYPGAVQPDDCAFQTFDRAHSIVDNGGTIYVGEGVFPETFTITKNVTVQGAGVDLTVIDGESSRWGVWVTQDPPNPVPTVTLSDFTVQHGSSAGSGAGVVNWGGTVTLEDCVIKDNTAYSGGGIYNGGSMTIQRCTISGNTATGTLGGGGVFNEKTLFIMDSSLKDNHADAINEVGVNGADGGGILNDNGSADHLRLIRVTLSANSAYEAGSALYDNGDGHVWLANVTAAGNSVSLGDGTVLIGPASSADIWSSTVAYNTSVEVGVPAGLVNAGMTMIVNTILAFNSNDECFVYSGAIINMGYNIETDTSCGLGWIQSTDPLLGPLQDNGGPTHTMVLLPGSPAIDMGYNTFCGLFPVDGMDQRGWSRPIDANGDGYAGCDIGAYEATIDLSLPLIMR